MSTDEHAEKTESPMALVAAVSPLAKIYDVRLSGSLIAIREHFDEPPAEIEHLFKTRHLVSGDRLTVVVDFHFAADKEKPIAADPLLCIDGRFTVDYSFAPADNEVTEEQLDAFARINGVYNVWPYWREYLQSTMARLRVPQFTMPLLTIGAILKSYKQARSERIDDSEMPDSEQDGT